MLFRSAQSDHNFIIHRILANTSHSITIVDLDHEIIRHEAQGRETTIYLLPGTRGPRWDYSQIIPKEGMAMKSPPGSISVRQGAGISFRITPELGFMLAVAQGDFSVK